jgi:hypothetical protein
MGYDDSGSNVDFTVEENPKTFTVRFEGKTYTCNEKQLRKMYLAIGAKLGIEDSTKVNTMLQHKDEMLGKFKNGNGIESPRGYRFVFSEKSEAQSGAKNLYYYFDDPESNWKFTLIDEVTRVRKKGYFFLGKIEDTDSLIGRFWKTFPAEPMFKRQLKKLPSYPEHLDDQRLKGCLDVLVHEKFLEKDRVDGNTLYKKTGVETFQYGANLSVAKPSYIER